MESVQPLVHKKRLGDFVFEKLLRAVKSGAYRPDERLPSEHELALEFQVSRPVVRDALQRLRAQGLIYSRRGAGSFVRNPGVREPLGFGQLENLSDLRQCYEFRLTLEPQAAASAAERHDEQSLGRIAEALNLLRVATDQRRHREDADFMFHFAIANAARNQYFTTAMDALEDHIAVGMQFHGISLRLTSGGLQHAFAEHAEIFDAIRNRDAEAARAAMRKHLEGSRDRLFEGN